jgi:anti-sigma B factor antagonist
LAFRVSREIKNQQSKIENVNRRTFIMAELSIRERQAGDVTILDMDGRITIGEGSVALRSAIRRLLEEGKKKILLNLAGVGYIDSSGIGELVSSYTAINKDGGQLKLLSLTQKLQDLLTITKLLTVFDAYDTEAEALNNFK